jgi:hypothetical protein
MIVMTIEEQQRLLNQYSWFDFLIGDFLIRRIGKDDPAPPHPNNINEPMKDKLITLLNYSAFWAILLRDSGAADQLKSMLTEHIEELKATVKGLKESDMDLACPEEQAHSDNMKYERENDHLIHALHDVRVELARTNEGLRSLSIVLSKLDLGNTENIEMKVSELTGTVNEVKTTTLKVLAEIRARIDLADARIVTLEGQLADADVPEAAATALAELKTVVGQLDDIVPDSPDLPPVTPPVVTSPTVP